MISWHNLEILLNECASFEEPVVGINGCAIAYDYGQHRLSLEIPVASSDLPSSLLKEITFNILCKNDENILSIACYSEDLFRSFYDFIREILEQVGVFLKSPQQALHDAWETWGRLIERESSLSREKQVGLLGELVLLKFIAEGRGWRFALDAWHDDSRSEHDFCLSTADIEVKTCTTEKRIHQIGSLTQLQNSSGRDLYLFSVQLTSAPSIAEDSFSLASVVDLLLETLKEEPKLCVKLKRRLEQAGWRESHMNFYDSTFVFRNSIKIISIDDSFPRIIESTISHLGREITSRIVSVGYRIDVTGLGFNFQSTEFWKQVK